MSKPEVVAEVALYTFMWEQPRLVLVWVKGQENKAVKGTQLIRLTDHEADRAADKARIAELTEALKSAREMVADWGAYASEYFREKHGLDRDIAELDAVIAQQGKENES